MLFILGFTPMLVAFWARPAWAAIFGQNILWFILSYSLGIMIAIGLMGRAGRADRWAYLLARQDHRFF